jgi:secondary thiamine-phosphate synthase enzyme
MRNLPIITQPLRTTSRDQMLEITDHVQRLVAQNNIQSGLAIVCVPHTTAAITINENADPDVKHDMLEKLATLIPHRETYYQHGEGNSDSHVKTSLVGNSVTLVIEGGKLVLGTWQGIQFCEFDGPRSRKYLVKLVTFDSSDS